jgi:chromosome segregation ATPase
MCSTSTAAPSSNAASGSTEQQLPLQMADMEALLQQATEHANACQQGHDAAQADMKVAQRKAERWQAQCEALRKSLADASATATKTERSMQAVLVARDQRIAQLEEAEVRLRAMPVQH